jgi:hypothetical protein
LDKGFFNLKIFLNIIDGVIKNRIVLSILISVSVLLGKSLKSQDISPQIWNNVSVVWAIDDRFSWGNNAAYNVLISNEFPWSELTLTSTGAFRFANYFETIFGFYSAYTKQSISVNSFEFRPYIGFNAMTNNKRRWIVSNLTRFEMRYLIYTENNSNDISFRLRNRTLARFSIIKKSISIDKNNLFVFGYFEAFFNFGEEVEERFFNHFKYKLGFGYRLNYRWGFDLGVMIQDSKDNIVEPSHQPSNLITNYILEWGVRIIIGSKDN